jgi:hypothetical protein
MNTKTKTTATKLFHLQSTITPSDGHARRIGYLTLDLPTLRELVALDSGNRIKNFPHIILHAENMAEGRFLWDAYHLTISWDDQGTDGAHRLGGAVMAFGSDADVAAYCEKYAPDGKIPKVVSAFRTRYRGQPDWKAYCSVSMNLNPKIFEVQDQDMRKRTGADMLTHNAHVSNWLSEAGLSGPDYQTILRFVYLRTTPGKSYSNKEKPGTARYGYLAKGGNVSPNRYPLFESKFGVAVSYAHNYISEAMEPHGDTTYGLNACTFALTPHIYALGTLIELGTQSGDLDVKTLIRFKECVRNWTRFEELKSGVLVSKCTGFAGLLNKMKTAGQPMPKSGHIFSALVHQVMSPKSDTLTHWEQWQTVLGTNPEQQPTLRLPGIDSTHEVA